MSFGAASVPTFPETFNMADYFLDQRIREGLGDKTAVIDDHGSYTYGQIVERSEQVCGALWQADIRPEDRCLIGLPDCVEFIESFFGILKAGAVVAMVNPELPTDDYLYYLRYTRCRALIVDADLALRIAPLLHECDCLKALLIVGDYDIGLLGSGQLPSSIAVIPWDLVRQAPRRGTYPTSKDDPSVWLFTSGSTGKPKAAVHFHHDFPWNTECYAKQVLGLTQADRTTSVSRLYFGYATGTNLMFPFAVGATCVLFRGRPTPETLFSRIQRNRVTVLASVPTSLQRMLDHDPEADLSSLRIITSAGEALPPELSERFRRNYGVEILDGIGSAELFHIYISNRPGQIRSGSLGTLVPGYSARIVRPDGTDAAPGEIGTLWVCGDSAALCYFQAHEQSKATLRGDWVVSGDLFHRDAEGFFYYDGRADDLLKVGGIFVSPLEVENVLTGHPAVIECAVVGEENQNGLVRALAYVVVRSGHRADEQLADSLISFCKEQLAHYKAPSRVEFVPELPRSDRGKILRRVLRRVS
ncbi:MAG: benzoate-CoA ligase family protein [Myxococcales bacterium]|nr:benzoate-CoA ligase family protein [Myxococcales bacterium]